MLDRLRSDGFELEMTNHADAILHSDFRSELEEVEHALDGFRISAIELIEGGGGEAPFTQRLRRRLVRAGWKKHNFQITKAVDGTPRESTSHEIDHVRFVPRGTLALEIEWNNKSEFFDRDLESFKRLHSEGVFAVAILITRGLSSQNDIRAIVTEFANINKISSFEDLEQFGKYDPSRKLRRAVNKRVSKGEPFRDAWVRYFVASKYAKTTTHWGKLEDRIKRGVGNPCPMLFIGLPSSIVHFGPPDIEDA